MEKMPIKNKLAENLVRLGVSANFLTLGGLFLAFCAGVLIYYGNFFIAGVVLLMSGLFDVLDGAVARASGAQGPFGGILDSSLDRYGDGAVLGAVAVYYGRFADLRLSILAVVALVGSFAISYIRARAECEIDHCRVGFWERGERLVFIASALLINNVGAALLVLGIGTHWTALQRLCYAHWLTKKQDSKNTPFYLRSSSRNSWPYFLKILLLIAYLCCYPVQSL